MTIYNIKTTNSALILICGKFQYKKYSEKTCITKKYIAFNCMIIFSNKKVFYIWITYYETCCFESYNNKKLGCLLFSEYAGDESSADKNKILELISFCNVKY